MKAFDVAIVSAHNPKDVVGILTVWAKDIKEALKRVRQDSDMAEVRCYPYGLDA